MTETTEAHCVSPWCGMPFDEREGWAGYCPACLALADEHLANGHASSVEGCIACDRTPMPVARRLAHRAA